MTRIMNKVYEKNVTMRERENKKTRRRELNKPNKR